MPNPMLDPQEILNRAFDSTNNALQTNTTVTSDIEIGAVEIKNATTDTRAIVLAASTAAAATDTPLVVALHPTSPLPAGTAAIGKLAANSGVDIGDVDVTSLPATPAGTNLIGKVSIDQVTANANEVVVKSITAGDTNIGNVDIASIAAGDNNIGNVDVLTIAAGDNNIGNVDVVSQIPGTGATNLGKAIDSVGGATDTGVAPLAIRDDALAALTPIEGDYVALRTDANGALWTHDDALDAALAGSELQVDVVAALPAGTNAIGKLAANTGVDIGDVDILSIAAGDNNIGNVDIVSGTVTTVSTVTNLAQLGGAAVSMGTGARDAGTQRVTVATDDAVPVTNAGLTELAAAINATSQMQVEHNYTLGRVVADGQIKGSAGFLHALSIAPLTATPTAGLVTVYDAATETGTVIYSEWVFATTPGHTVVLDVTCGTGIYVGFDAALANVQVTASYR